MLVTPISSYFLWREGPNIYINGVIRYCSDNIARIFSCTMLCEASGTTLHRICSCLLSEALRTTLYRAFYLCNVVLAVLRQHCTWFFSCLMLFGASRALLHKVSSVQYYPQNISWGNIAQEKLYVCCPWGSRQRCIKRKNPLQCCLNTLGTTLHR